MKELTINWHITESCNLKCKFCFAKWEKDCKQELLHNSAEVYNLLDQIDSLRSYFSPIFDSIRINLVGGETFLYVSAVINIIKESKKRGFRVSAITNGTKLNSELNEIIANNLDIIGFSIDSINKDTNIKIGRSINKISVNNEKIAQDIIDIKNRNPDMLIKINTVVNKLNYFEDMGSFIEKIRPYKWKIFKVLPLIDSSLSITDKELEQFINSHRKFDSIMSIENNDDMISSYLMIDPLGRFFQNKTCNGGYIYSEAINKIGILNALEQIPFDIEKFKRRYNKL